MVDWVSTFDPFSQLILFGGGQVAIINGRCEPFMHGHLLRLISGRFLVRAKIINK